MVKLGAAHIDEHGNAKKGDAGDQTGREVCVRNYYVHSKGWRVFRPVNKDTAEKIALDCQAACDNRHIGYDQGQRNTLYDVAKPLGFDCAKVTKNCETDCSALVRVCCAYAGIDLPNFRTDTEAKVLLSSGAFVELSGDQYTKRSDYLRRGDILVTCTRGHTEIVLTSGAKAIAAPAPLKLGDRILKNGMVGADVKEMQQGLIRLGYNCGKWGADGDFGDSTEIAVRAFQTQEDLKPDGQFGPKSLAAMNNALVKLDTQPSSARYVKIYGGSCYVRAQPDRGAAARGVISDGTILKYAGETAENGWLGVIYKDAIGWVSNKYGRLVD